ncbi:pilus assembly protein PilP [Halomonas sp.]|uniref:pilus assembly protein PilP n=1 Tax=Halomonas sp. TaxID=1486246 RepID=UPI00235646A2|nr:pilus assembly protein PilP [Halomonas sp.]
MMLSGGAGRLVSLVAWVLLAGCSDPRLAELDRRLAALRDDPGAVPSFESLAIPESGVVEYRPSEKRSPFRPEAPDASPDASAGSPGVPRAGRHRERLEAYALDALDLVGTLTMRGESSALFREPGGRVRRLRVGHHLGRDHGRILSITSTSVLLVERVMVQGDWVQRHRELTLE